MKLKVKDMNIATGGPLVVILNENDAIKLDIHHIDRIKIKKGKEIETVVVNITTSKKTGIVKRIDNRTISRIAGAPLNKGSGIYLHKHIGNKLKKETSFLQSILKVGKSLSLPKSFLKAGIVLS